MCVPLPDLPFHSNLPWQALAVVQGSPQSKTITPGAASHPSHAPCAKLIQKTWPESPHCSTCLARVIFATGTGQGPTGQCSHASVQSFSSVAGFQSYLWVQSDMVFTSVVQSHMECWIWICFVEKIDYSWILKIFCFYSVSFFFLKKNKFSPTTFFIECTAVFGM